MGYCRYLPLAQFTEARPVECLGPFSLASLSQFINSCLANKAYNPQKRHALQQLTQIGVPARLFESPRHSGATDEGIPPRLLYVRVPGACQERRPTRSFGWPKIKPTRSIGDCLTRSPNRHGVQADMESKTWPSRLARLGNYLCKPKWTPRDLA